MTFGCIKMIFIICLLDVIGIVSSSYINTSWEHRSDDNYEGPGMYVIRSLRFVAVLFSHGNKTPEFSYNTDPHKNYFREGKGELAKQYNGFLSELYMSSEILAQSTKIGRTIMSAKMVLAGLYPPKQYQKWSNTVWQPIPVFHDSPDHGLIPKGVCPSYDSIRQQLFVEYNPYSRNKKELLETLSKMCKEEITDENAHLLYDLFSCQLSAKLPQPNWMLPDGFQNMKSIFMREEVLREYYGNMKIQKIIIGPLLKEIALTMESNKSANKKNTKRKMHIYLGYNDTISSAISFLSTKYFKLPDPGASLHFHLYYSFLKGYYIKLFYYETWYTQQGEEIPITETGDTSTLDMFVKKINKTFASDWDAVCRDENL